MLPKNPSILLSVVNMKLRDFYENLDDLVEDLDESKEQIILILKEFGYQYDEILNQFVSII